MKNTTTVNLVVRKQATEKQAAFVSDLFDIFCKLRIKHYAFSEEAVIETNECLLILLKMEIENYEKSKAEGIFGK